MNSFEKIEGFEEDVQNMECLLGFLIWWRYRRSIGELLGNDMGPD
jgi:hypothetical protein